MAGANFITAMDNGLEATYNFNEELFRGLAPMIESKDALFGMADALNSQSDAGGDGRLLADGAAHGAD